MDHLLSLPIFWKDGRVLKYWVDLCECLKQELPNRYIYLDLLNSETNQKLLNIRKSSWWDKINDPLKEYLILIQDQERPVRVPKQLKRLNSCRQTQNRLLQTRESQRQIKTRIGKSVFQLLKAIRNTASHTFGTDIKAFTIEKKQKILHL